VNAASENLRPRFATSEKEYDIWGDCWFYSRCGKRTKNEWKKRNGTRRMNTFYRCEKEGKKTCSATVTDFFRSGIKSMFFFFSSFYLLLCRTIKHLIVSRISNYFEGKDGEATEKVKLNFELRYTTLNNTTTCKTPESSTLVSAHLPARTGNAPHIPPTRCSCLVCPRSPPALISASLIPPP